MNEGGPKEPGIPTKLSDTKSKELLSPIEAVHPEQNFRDTVADLIAHNPKLYAPLLTPMVENILGDNKQYLEVSKSPDQLAWSIYLLLEVLYNKYLKNEDINNISELDAMLDTLKNSLSIYKQRAETAQVIPFPKNPTIESE